MPAGVKQGFQEDFDSLDGFLKAHDITVRYSDTDYKLYRTAVYQTLRYLNTEAADDILTMLGLERTDNVVVDRFTGKSVDAFNVEHGPGCKMHKAYQRAKGGSSVNAPAPYRVFCAPTYTKGLCPAIYDLIAREAVAAHESNDTLQLPNELRMPLENEDGTIMTELPPEAEAEALLEAADEIPEI